MRITLESPEEVKQRLPRTLQMILKDFRIKSILVELTGYWLVLRDGWCAQDERHIIFGLDVEEVVSKMNLKRCLCLDCRHSPHILPEEKPPVWEIAYSPDYNAEKYLTRGWEPFAIICTQRNERIVYFKRLKK